MFDGPSTPKEARRLGLTRYVSGKPCPKGHNGERYTVNSGCVICCSETDKEAYYADRERNWGRSLWHNAKNRASKFGLAFDIEMADITIPDFCPVLGIPITMGVSHPHANSPTIDRVTPEKGYIKSNVVVISHRANRLKNDATTTELRLLADFYERINLDV